MTITILIILKLAMTFIVVTKITIAITIVYVIETLLLFLAARQATLKKLASSGIAKHAAKLKKALRWLQ